jgi:trigger factor
MLVNIEVEEERVEKAMDQAYRRLVGRINVPGFRKGKAPRALVERMVGREALLEDAIEILVPSVYQEALHSEGIRPAAQPRFEVVSVSPLQVKATVPLQPQVKLGDYRSIRVTPDPTDVTEQDVQEVVNQVRESHAQWTPVERAVQLGDRVSLDLRAMVGERTLLDSKDAEYVVDPDGRQPAPGFADQLPGMSAGETKDFTLTLSPELSDEELAGKEAAFSVALHGVKEKQLPDLDDAFVSGLGQRLESVQQLQDEIRKDLQARKESASRSKLEQEALDAAVGGSTIELPPQLVEEETEHLRERFARNLDRQGITVEQYLRFARKNEAEFRAELAAEAEADLKRTFVLRAIADAENIEVDDSEVDEEIRRMGTDTPDSQRTVKNALARPETRERVRAVLRERKAVRRLVDIAVGAQEAQATSGETAE